MLRRRVLGPGTSGHTIIKYCPERVKAQMGNLLGLWFEIGLGLGIGLVVLGSRRLLLGPLHKSMS